MNITDEFALDAFLVYRPLGDTLTDQNVPCSGNDGPFGISQADPGKLRKFVFDQRKKSADGFAVLPVFHIRQLAKNPHFTPPPPHILVEALCHLMSGSGQTAAHF